MDTYEVFYLVLETLETGEDHLDEEQLKVKIVCSFASQMNRLAAFASVHTVSLVANLPVCPRCSLSLSILTILSLF